MARDKDDYLGDVIYEVWRSGGDVDRIDYDRVQYNQYDGFEFEQAARVEMRHQKPPQPDPEPEFDFDTQRIQDDHDYNR